jgi:PIN domain nuclease of toxin-antitoxin system
VKFLLVTHILLWWPADDPNLPPLATDAIASPDVGVIVSAATAWEIAIKRADGRLEAPDDLLGALEANDFDSLPVTVAHVLQQEVSPSTTATRSTGC